MRVALAFAAAALSVPAGASTVFQGSINPPDGINIQSAGDYRPGQTRVSLKVAGTEFDGGSSYLIVRHSYSIFDQNGADVGDDIYLQDDCDFGAGFSCAGAPDPGTGLPTPLNFMRDIVFTPTEFSYTVTRPQNYDNCNGQIGVICAEGWDFSDGLFFGTKGAGTYTLSYTAVPEPASWAMMLSGFGLVGSIMRRKKLPSSLASGTS
jgi:hypothetical protein